MASRLHTNTSNMAEHLIGVISDTHGLLRPEALAALKGVSLILHAGDVGKPEILDRLREVAPVRAVRGNIDKGAWAQQLPTTEVIEVGGVCLYMLHILEDLDLDPVAAGFQAVIFGHSHKPSQEVKQGVVYLNPGSAGPRRFRLPVSLALLRIQDGEIEVEGLELV